MRILGKDRIFGKEISALGNADLLICIIILGSSGLGLLVLADINYDFYTTIGELGIFTICGMGPILFAILLYGWRTNQNIKNLKKEAERRELALDYNSAIEIWESLGEIEEAARVRKLKTEEGAVKVTQKVVQGDEVTKTEIKDSVLNRSNVGGGSSKMQELKDLTEMKEKGLIDDDEFKQMKKEILGK